MNGPFHALRSSSVPRLPPSPFATDHQNFSSAVQINGWIDAFSSAAGPSRAESELLSFRWISKAIPREPGATKAGQRGNKRSRLTRPKYSKKRRFPRWLQRRTPLPLVYRHFRASGCFEKASTNEYAKRRWSRLGRKSKKQHGLEVFRPASDPRNQCTGWPTN